MKFREFQQQTIRTLPNLHKKYLTVDNVRIETMPLNLLDLIHMRLGMVSELPELLNGIRSEDSVNIGEELADQLWYIANDLTISKRILFIDEGIYESFAKIEFSSSPMATDGGHTTDQTPSWFPALVYNSGELADQVKKWLAYGKAPKKEDYVKHMSYLIGAINNMAITKNVDLEVYMERVIAKLKSRYPDKFEEDKAINRNLEAEREKLEGK